MAHAQFHHAPNIFRARLRECIENRVAAADVRLHRMFRANAVTQLYVMHVARTAAVAVVFARGEERAEDAVLHVKHGDMLVNCDLKPIRRRRVQECFELQEIQIV